MKVNRHCVARRSQEQGAVLITVLVMLLILTLLGISGVQNTTLEERMAGNFRDRQLAFQAAEAALREGENQVTTDALFNALGFDNGTDGDGAYDVIEDDQTNRGLDPYNLPAGLFTVAGTYASVTAQPNYYIERLPKVDLPRSSQVKGFHTTPPKVNFYRVTGQGFGQSGASEVILQSTVYR